MRSNLKSLFIVSTIAGMLGGCSYVEPKPGSELVVLSNDSSKCKTLAETEVSVKDTFLLWDRERTTVEDELRIMARNEALRLDGNAIWPLSEIKEGRQRFRILSCPIN